MAKIRTLSTVMVVRGREYEINTLRHIHIVIGGMTADLYRGIGTNFKHNNLISGKKSKRD